MDKKTNKEIFLPVYLVVNFFILIGEISGFVFYLPVKLFLFLTDQMTKLILTMIKFLEKKRQDIKAPPITQRKLTKLYQWRVDKLPVKKLVIGLGRVIIQAVLIVGRFCRTVAVKILMLLISLVVWFLKITYKITKNIYSGVRFIYNSVSIKARYFILGFTICLTVILIYQGYLFIIRLPSPNDIGRVNYSLSTHILDRNGKLLYEIYREQNRTPVKITELPSYVYQAAIAIEDKDFYRHKGVSIIGGILRALKEMAITKTIQGGSTITQQLVKSALLTPERTIRRKVREIILAMWTERIFTKEQILEMYLNQVPYGGSAYGIEEASRTYFDKHANELTLAEAALLAGLPQAPSIYSPYINPDEAIWRRNEVLKNMKEQGHIDEELRKRAVETPLEVVPPKTLIKAPHFVFYVKSQLEREYGIKQVEEGGMRVISTLDLELQNETEKILKEELEKVRSLNVTNGAIIVTRPQTGEILAMVGSEDYFASPSGAFNVTTALRQPGSSIKPIMYSLALNRGYTAATVIDDSPVVFMIAGSEAYRPVNYDSSFHGRVPLRYALANSYNVPAVKVLNSIGVDNFVNHARRMGISTWNDSSRFGLSLTLGGGEVMMTDMAKAFGVFANQGYKVNLTSTLTIENTHKEKIFTNYPVKTRVLDAGTAFIISDILSDNFARQMAFGPRSSLEIPGYQVAVKTGTTNEKKDNWTIGYTPEFLVAVWVGNNDNTPMNRYLSSGITGASPIWNRVMTYILKKYGDSKTVFEKPADIVEKLCYFGRKEYFIKGTETKVTCRDSLFGTTPTPTP